MKRNLNRTGKFVNNLFFATCHQVVVLAVGFIIPRFMLEYYGSEINGLITSITQFIEYFSLVEAGLSSASIFALYKPLSKDDHKEISAIVVATRRFYMISGYIFLALVISFALIYPLTVNIATMGRWQITILVLILGFGGVLEFFTLGKYRALLTADQKLYVISISSILYTILNTSILVILSIMRVHIVIVRASMLSAILLRCVILFQYSRKNYSYIDYKEKPNNIALNKRWDALYSEIMGAVYRGTPVVIATIFTNLKTVSVYSIYNMVMGGISSILNVCTNSLFSSFGDIIARNETKLLQKAYQEFEFAYYSFIAIIYSVSFIMIMPFIYLYTKNITDTNYYDPILGSLFVINALLYNLKTPQGMLVISAGHYRETRLQVTIQGGIVILAGVLLVSRFGLAGILLGSIASNIYRVVDLFLYVPRKITKLSVYSTVKRVLCLIMEVVIICFPFQYFDTACESYFRWVQLAVVSTMYAGVVILLFGWIFNRKEMKGICNRMIALVKKL